MMKRSLVVVFFFMGIVLLGQHAFPVYASDLPPLAQKEMASSSSEKTATFASPLKHSDYTLPYPGILPTHPLYFLKAFRDRIMLMLIGDMVKKTEFAILQADKRVNAAIMLRAQGNNEVAQTTMDKAQKYREQAIGYLQQAQKEGKDTTAVRHKLDISYEKHQEVLEDIISNTSGKEQSAYQNMLEKVKENRSTLQGI